MPGARRRRAAVLRALVVGLLGALVIGTVAYAVTTDLDRSAALAGIASLLVSAAGVGLDLTGFFTGPDRTDAALDALVDDLAATVQEQWSDEAHARRLRDPHVLPLSWAASPRAVADANATVGADPAGQPVRVRLDGRMEGAFDDVLSRLAAGFRQLPSRRLVLLGEPGSGKSMLSVLLTLGLLRDRPAGGPVPVLLAVSSWDPAIEELDAWMVRTLATTYYNGRRDVSRRLLRHGLLLPVLDGLDEIPEPARRGAVKAINRAVGSDRPIVVTCRAAEYEDLIRGGAPTLRRAPVVEIRPVPPTDVIDYLRAVDWPAPAGWEPVYRALRDEPASPVAEALTTPLMVSLARTVHQRLPDDPGDLVDTARFDSRYAIEDHLSDRVIDAAYAPSAGRPGADADAARRWLTFLATYLHRHRERDIA